MSIFHSTYVVRRAGTLILALGLAGWAYGSSRASTQKTQSAAHPHHASAKRTTAPSHRAASSHSTSLHHASVSHASRRRRSRHRRATVTGQRVIDSQRATEIQQALIQAHYLNGSPTGQWDADTQAAMVKYQTDNGWQSKITPDSRALIKLGLGPKQDAGEYAPRPSGSSEVSKTPNAPPTDTIGTMANSEIPMSTSTN
ncbi:MAG: peptidoglycan-binding domain-containing protein [Acidobacteriaceae bacterium]